MIESLKRNHFLKLADKNKRKRVVFCSDIISTAKKLAVSWLTKGVYYTSALQQTKRFWNYLNQDVTVKGNCTLYCNRNSGDGSWALAITSGSVTNSFSFASRLPEQSSLRPWELRVLHQGTFGLWAASSRSRCRAGTAGAGGKADGTTRSVLPSCPWGPRAPQQLEELIDHFSAAVTELGHYSDYKD